MTTLMYVLGTISMPSRTMCPNSTPYTPTNTSPSQGLDMVHTFAFDHVFGMGSTQEEVYISILPLFPWIPSQHLQIICPLSSFVCTNLTMLSPYCLLISASSYFCTCALFVICLSVVITAICRIFLHLHTAVLVESSSSGSGPSRFSPPFLILLFPYCNIPCST